LIDSGGGQKKRGVLGAHITILPAHQLEEFDLLLGAGRSKGHQRASPYFSSSFDID
jgi:hypothetical protein